MSAGNATLPAALALIRQGVHVLPVWPRLADGTCTCGAPACPSPGKHPKTNRGWKDASTSGRTVHWWFSGSLGPDEPVPWLGVVGHLSGLAFLDVDPRNGGAMPEGLPATRVERTPGGGWHLWYRADPRRRLPGKAGPGLDVLHRGRYIVTAPTPGYSVVSRAPVAPWPEGLVSYIEPGAGRPGRPGGDANVVERCFVRCPAHKGKGAALGQERTPSLQVSKTIEGLTLLHCFAGCPTADVLTAWGKGWGDLFPPPLELPPVFRWADDEGQSRARLFADWREP